MYIKFSSKFKSVLLCTENDPAYIQDFKEVINLLALLD